MQIQVVYSVEHGVFGPTVLVRSVQTDGDLLSHQPYLQHRIAIEADVQQNGPLPPTMKGCIASLRFGGGA